ncbi:Fur family transcriptional regulator [Anaerobaca lacustris]|uniref:Transcriptional repressor n=1 Tax=Anaerobaca lacustris TaxID=3044600 RepID=A0AAW6TS95_9BACT|nr:transcriptional repressor [Sedimentisphaerales bacterium M17dextr]
MAVSKSEIERRMRRFAETCQAGGLKLTHQRMEVFRELAGTDDHPDAETIYQNVRRRVPAISRDTVYRTLATLEEQGLVHKAEILSGRGRYDANMDHHHHFVCTECGRVHDFYSQALDDLPIPRSVTAIGRVESTQVQLRGICAGCAKSKC